MRALMMSGVTVGSFWTINAAAADTSGVAMLVPLRRMYLELESWVHKVMPSRFTVHTFNGTVGTRLSVELSESKVLLGASSETIRLPRATMSGFTTWSIMLGPLELKLGTASSVRILVSWVLVAPTVMTAGSLPGAWIVP